MKVKTLQDQLTQDHEKHVIEKQRLEAQIRREVLLQQCIEISSPAAA